MSGADESLPGIGPMFPDGKTRAPSRLWPTPTRADGERGSKVYQGNHNPTLLGAVLTSSAGASPASPSPSLASAEDRTTSDGSGPSSLGSFAYYDPDTSSWRTFQGSLLEEWATFSGTWPRAGTTRSGTASRRQPSVPLTSVTGSSSWPTPTALEDRNERMQMTDWNGENRHSMTLAQAVRWPTPRAQDGPHGPARDSLGDVVRFRSPQARDGDQRGPSSPERRAEQGYSVSLHDQIGGQLNPTWVEWLMGFPLGWTDLEDSETPSSRRLPSGSEGD